MKSHFAHGLSCLSGEINQYLMPHLWAQVLSMEGFGLALILAWIVAIWLSESPVVARMALNGSTSKKILDVVTVPASRLGKLAMNWASWHSKF